MSTLFLVRHGQASFLAADYDQLSSLGEQQAALFGTWLARHEIHVDRVFVGPRRRHRQTLDHAAQAYGASGHAAFPEPEPLAELDEYQAEEVMKHALSELPDDFRPLVEDVHRAADHRHRTRSAEKLLQAVLRKWVAGEIVAEGVESFPAFRDRIRRAVATVTAGAGRGKNVLAFTSGGTIGAAVGNVLRTDDAATFDLTLGTHNAAFAELLFSGGEASLSGARISVSSFNAKPHLEPGFLTYR